MARSRNDDVLAGSCLGGSYLCSLRIMRMHAVSIYLGDDGDRLLAVCEVEWIAQQWEEANHPPCLWTDESGV